MEDFIDDEDSSISIESLLEGLFDGDIFCVQEKYGIFSFFFQKQNKIIFLLENSK